MQAVALKLMNSRQSMYISDLEVLETAADVPFPCRGCYLDAWRFCMSLARITKDA